MLKSLFVRHKPLYKLFTVLLIVSILFTGGSLTAFAEVQWPEPSNLIVEELEEKRTEYSKTYLRNDGQLETVVSAIPIHYKENGAWVEYDNTLIEDNNGNLKNNKSPFKVQLPVENGNNKEISLTKDDYYISLKLVGAKNSKANKKVKEENRTSRKNKTAQEMLNDSVVLTNSVTYANALDNTDIVYDVKTNTLKESIILKSQPKKAVSYTYQIRTENLTPVLNENGSVSFYDEKDATKLIFYIPAPFMFDSNDAYSYDIKTNLEIKNKKATLTYTPNFEWLTNSERAYPVTVDPSVTDKEIIDDAYTYSATEKHNAMLGFENQLKVGKTPWLSAPGEYDCFETYIQFRELPETPEGYVVSNASIKLTVKQLCGTWSHLSIGSYLIVEDWENELDGEYLTYTNRPECANTPSTIKNLYRSSLSIGSVASFDVSTLTKYWYKYPETNHGIRLTMQNVDDTDDDWDSIIFYSTENYDDFPYLSITFQPEADVTGIQITDKPANNTFTYFEQRPYHQFTYSLTPSNAKNEDVAWSVSNEDVATISENGLLYAFGEGTITVSAYLKNNPSVSNSFSLNIVKSPIMSLTVEEVEDIFVGGSFQLTPTVETEIPINVNYTYSSSNPRIADVSPTGKITGVSLGTSYITITPVGYPEATIKVPVNVTNLINNLPENNELEFYEYWQLSTIEGVELTTDNPNLISIQGNGRIRAIEYGSAHVTATLKDEYNEIIAQETCVITITGNLRLNCMPKDNVMSVNSTLYLSTDPNFAPELVTWISDDPSVASVVYEETGHGWELRSHSRGKTTLIAFLTDPDTGKEYYGYASVWVANYDIQSIDVSITNHETPVVYCGEVFTVRATIIPAKYDHDETIWEEDSTFLERVNIPNVDYSNSRYIQYKAKNVEGMTGITFMVNDTIVSIPVEVKRATIDIENKPTLSQMIVGTTHNLDVNIQGAATFKGWSIESVDNSVAEINPNTGVITAKAPGTVTITAKAQLRNSTATISESFTLTVAERSVSVTDLPYNLTLAVGNSHKFKVEKFPSNGVVHYSYDGEYISISDNTIYAKKSGEVTVSYYMKHGSWTSETKTFTVKLVMPDLNITNKPANNTLWVGATYNLGYAFTSNNQAPVSWISSKSSVASIGPFGNITVHKAGKTTITAISSNEEIPSQDSFELIVIPNVFGNLIANGIMTAFDYTNTEDGFYISTKSLGEMLIDKNINYLIDDEGKQVESNIYYEDWYLYSIAQGNQYAYSLIKLRETENDDKDGDDPGVGISFIPFFTNKLFDCIYNPVDINRFNLYEDIQKTVFYKNQRYSDILYNYFSSVSAKAPYLIADLYIQHLAKFVKNGCVEAPDAYEAYLEKKPRVHDALKALNKDDNIIYNENTHEVYIANPNALTEEESYALFMMHTGNVNKNSFAAEVKYHADGLKLWDDLKLIDIFGAYNSASRADMAIGEGNKLDPKNYYKLDHKIVKEQAEMHGVC